jgi:hypothetical protein
VKLSTPNVCAPNFTKHILKDLKPQIDSNTVVVGNFNTPLSPIDSDKKINKEILELNNTMYFPPNRLYLRAQSKGTTNIRKLK